MIVLDANVLVSGLGWPRSVPGRFLDRLMSRYELAITDTVFDEAVRALTGKIGMPREQAVGILASLELHVLGPAAYGNHMDAAAGAITDASHAPVVALALALDAPVVSGDRHFHPLQVPKVQTFTPRQFLDSLGRLEG